MGRFMARDYVTLREEQRDGETVWTETSVGRALLKSVPARVTRKDGQYRIVGAAWGAPIAKRRGAGRRRALGGRRRSTAARRPSSPGRSGRSTGQCRRRASTRSPRAPIDTQGKVQPAMDDPIIAKKRTYWESNGQVTRKIQLT